MKSLIVTGGANGLGRSIAQSASDAGYRVGIIDVNIDSPVLTVRYLKTFKIG